MGSRVGRRSGQGHADDLSRRAARSRTEPAPPERDVLAAEPALEDWTFPVSDSPAEPDELVRAFTALPRRVFLDSNVVQTLREAGGYLWESEGPPASAQRIHGRLQDLEALRRILAVNERAGFELVLSEASIVEAVAKNDSDHLRWAHDVLDPWLVSLAQYRDLTALGGKPHVADLLPGEIGHNVGAKDLRLLQDAVILGCDGFLTMEGPRKLPSVSPRLERLAGLRIIRPPEYWALIEPWVSLYY